MPMHLLSSRRLLMHTLQTHWNTNVQLNRQPWRWHWLRLCHACCGIVGRRWPASRSSHMLSIQGHGWPAKYTCSARGVAYTKQVPNNRWHVPMTDAAGKGQR